MSESDATMNRSSDTSSRQTHKIPFSLLITVFLDFLSFAIVLPILAGFVTAIDYRLPIILAWFVYIVFYKVSHHHSMAQKA
jgi:hypothetical protein